MMPLSFLSALTEDKRAMRNFAALDEEEKALFLIRSKQAGNGEEIRNLAMSLSDRSVATEYFDL